MTNMSIEELIKEDSSFNESGFLAKVDNTFIMLHYGIMLGTLERVKHKITPKLIERYEKVIDNLIRRNERQMYDEINVKSTEIKKITKLDDRYVIEVLLVSRYMEYIVDKTTMKFKSGINDHRIEKKNYLTFSKRINSEDEGLTRKCPGCGANINANYSGKCEYCGTTYDTETYDWVLEDIIVNV